MKRLFLFPLILSVLSLSAFGAVYRSNELGQKFEEKDGLDRIGFELVYTENTEKLYENGTVLTETIRYSDGYEKSREGVVERVFVDEEGKPQRRILTSGETHEEYNYFYEGRLLSSYNYSLEGEVVHTVRYLRTKDGVLLGYEDEDGFAFLSSDSYIYESDGETIKVSSTSEEEEVSLPERTVRENPDGGYTETFGETVRTYDGNGRLLQEEVGGEVSTYVYGADGELRSVKTTDGASVLETEYEKGKAARTLEYNDKGVLKTISTVLPDGTIEEIRYIDGVPRYRFVFDRDGKRIQEASGL